MLKLVDAKRSGSLVAVVNSHRRDATCWVVAHIYDSVLFRVFFSKERMAEAIHSEGATFITRFTHEPQWV